MPAAAVIPAPIAYIKVVAVKKLVVGFRGRMRGRRKRYAVRAALPSVDYVCSSGVGARMQIVYFE